MYSGVELTSFRNKLVLGTVQFGLDYGINNKTGKIPSSEVQSILQYCAENQIHFIDTSNAYGNAHEVIGQSIKKANASFNIISKLHVRSNGEIEKTIQQTFSDLQVDELYGYMCHNFNYFQQNTDAWKYFTALKSEGRVSKIGFSLYNPSEFEWLIQSGYQFDIIQVPFNIFDQRFSSVFQQCADAGIEVHVRSLFLQGLFFKSPEELPPNFSKVSEKIASLHQYAKLRNIPLQHLLLWYGLEKRTIDKVVIGVDSLSNLQSNLQVAESIQDNIDIEYLDSFRDEDESIIIPTNW